MDSMVHFGESVKALDETGRVGGYLIRFSDGSVKDLSGEYFDSQTYLGAKDADGVDTLFHHGIPLKAGLEAFADHIFAPLKTIRDDIGIFAEVVLNLADEYEAKVYELVKAGKLGWSSGAANHTVKRESNGYLKRWIVAEGSLTPIPCEPQNRILTLKALDGIKYQPLVDASDTPAQEPDLIKTELPLAVKLNQHIDDMVDDGRSRDDIVAKMAREAGIDRKAVDAVLSGLDTRPSDAKLKAFARVLEIEFDVLKSVVRKDYSRTVKGMFEEALAERSPSRWDLEATYSDILSKLASAATTSKTAGVTFNLDAKIQEATSEYANRLLTLASNQVHAYVETGDPYEPFYLKTVIDNEASVKRMVALDLDDHSQLAVSALKGISTRFRINHDMRVKSGRMLSERNRGRITELMGQLKAIGDEMQNLLDESTPMATEAEKYAAQSAFLRLQRRPNQLGAQDVEETSRSVA